MAKRIIITQKQLDEIVGGNSSYLDGLGTDFREDGTNAVYTGEKKEDSDDKPVTTNRIAQQLPKAPYFYRRDTRASYFESKKSDWEKRNLRESNASLDGTNISIDPTTKDNMVAGKDSAGANAVKNGNITYNNATTIKSRMDKLKDAVAKGDKNALQTYNNMGGDVFYDKINRELKNKTSIAKRDKDTMKQLGVEKDTRQYGNGKGHHTSEGIITPWVNEARSIKSQKLVDILNAHGGVYTDFHMHKPYPMTNADMHNLTDDRVIGVVEPEDVKSTIQRIMKEKLYGFVPGDEVDAVRLGDYKYVLLLTKNAHLYPSRMNEPNTFNDLVKVKRERDKNASIPDGAKNYQWKSKDAQYYKFQNPYYKNWSEESKKELNDRIKQDYKKQ